MAWDKNVHKDATKVLVYGRIYEPRELEKMFDYDRALLSVFITTGRLERIIIDEKCYFRAV